MQDYHLDLYYQDRLYKRTQDAYSLCLIGLFCSYFTIIAAAITAIANLPAAKKTPFYNHLLFVLLGTVYYTAAVGISVGIIIWVYRQHYISQGVFWMPLFCYLFFGLAPFIWWVVRFARGFKLLKNSRPLTNPYTPWMPK